MPRVTVTVVEDDDEDPEYAKQKAEWDAYAFQQELQGICPESGEKLKYVMDWWGYRKLMCSVCDCFGYPTIMSDYNPDAPLPEVDSSDTDW